MFEFMEQIDRHLDEKRMEQARKDEPGQKVITVMGVVGWILFVWYLIH